MPRPLGKPKEHGTAVQVGNEAPVALRALRDQGESQERNGDTYHVLSCHLWHYVWENWHYSQTWLDESSRIIRGRAYRSLQCLQFWLVTVLRLDTCTTCYIITMGGIQWGATNWCHFSGGRTSHPEKPWGPSQLGFEQAFTPGNTWKYTIVNH